VPLGAKEFRSYGASDPSRKLNSINIEALCGSDTEICPPALRLGLLCVRGLREEAGRAIVRARNERLFMSLDDLHHRVPELRKDELRKLAAVGAFNSIGAPTSCPQAGEARSSIFAKNGRTFRADALIAGKDARAPNRPAL